MAPSVTRRVVLSGTVSGLAMSPVLGRADAATPTHPPSSMPPQQRRVDVKLQINGKAMPLSLDPRTVLEGLQHVAEAQLRLIGRDLQDEIELPEYRF